jgi:NADH dehydrogenase
MRLILIEAADRVLPALPQRIADAALHLLESMRINVRTSALVAEVLPNGVRLASGEVIPAELVVWAAGVIAPDFLSDLDGLETNRTRQLVVRPTLQTTRDDDVFAIGDCAACPWLGKEGAIVPPRAQAAHQQASHMVKQMRRRLHCKPLLPWRYRDFGSLVSLGEFSTVGNLMGSLTGGNIWLEGWFARMMYLSLYKMHELALHGYRHRLLLRRTPWALERDLDRALAVIEDATGASPRLYRPP